MKLYIYLINPSVDRDDMIRFIKKFRSDNTLNICFVDTSKCLFEKYDLLISSGRIIYLPNTIKMLSFKNNRPHFIVIRKEKEVDLEVIPRKPDEVIIGSSFADFYSTDIFSDMMETAFGGSIWLNRMDDIIRTILDDKNFWE
jgi:hypothetical protein